MTQSTRTIGDAGRRSDGPHPGYEGSDEPLGDVGPPSSPRTVVFGGRERGRELSRRFAARGPVLFVDTSRFTVERAATEFDAVHVEGFGDADAIARAEITPDDHVVVATGRDSTNLLLAQVLRSAYGQRRFTVLIEDPTKRPAFEGLDIDIVCITEVVANVVLGVFERRTTEVNVTEEGH